MSHFTVLVIGENPKAQLAPFQENNDGTCPKKYLKFYDLEDEYRAKFESESVTKVIMPDGRMLNTWDDEFRLPGSFGLGAKTHSVPEHLEQREVKFTQLYSTFEEYMDDWCGYTADENGKFGYWENPNAKWDWYRLGGRWTGFFKLKPGGTGITGEPGLLTGRADHGTCDQSRVRDIDTTNLQTTYAVIKNGEWFEKGQMGWFGLSSNEDENWESRFKELVSELPEDTLLSLYDCHI